jgi:uracil-DNA glycosylase
MNPNHTPQIEAFLAELAIAETPADATNQFALVGPPGNAIRRANLALALQLALERGPDLLLIGEAPGYNGGRRTGVPFTSERLLLAGVDPPGQYGAVRGFQQATDDGRTSAEPTATLVYRELGALHCFVAGWNAYPFHPHRLNEPHSNRAPRAAEIRAGQPFLARFLAMFPGVDVVAMGNVAHKALAMLGVEHLSVRHPAQGGATIFATQIRAWAARKSGADQV